jgi:23S rRNA (guanosine2251-2'-O)-methyltransferase
MDQLEGRNPVIECLQRRRRRVHRVFVDRGARDDRRIARILELAATWRVPVERVERRQLDELSRGRVHNGVIAHADQLSAWTTKALLDDVMGRGEDPLLVLADAIAYEHNLGAIMRSALGFGVHGVVIPTRRGAGISPVVQRVSMGAVEEVPLVREGLSSALKHLKRAGMRVVGADAGGRPLGELDLRGPLVLAMGAEGEGLSHAVRQRCDAVVSIPLRSGLESLNVSVAAAILLYEKRRQDGWFDA